MRADESVLEESCLQKIWPLKLKYSAMRAEEAVKKKTGCRRLDFAFEILSDVVPMPYSQCS